MRMPKLVIHQEKVEDPQVLFHMITDMKFI